MSDIVDDPVAQKLPVEDFASDWDHTDPRWVNDPYPIWDDLRGRCPVAHTDRYGGGWFPTTHEMVSSIANDTENFTSRMVVVTHNKYPPNFIPAPIGGAPPITSDPPFHAIARRVILPAFAPGPVNALEPQIRALCNQHLDQMVGRRVRRRGNGLRAVHPAGRHRADAGFSARGRRHLPRHHPLGLGPHRPAARGSRPDVRTGQRLLREADRRSHRESSRRPHDVSTERRSRRQEARAPSRVGNDRADPHRRHRHDVVGDRLGDLAPGKEPR